MRSTLFLLIGANQVDNMRHPPFPSGLGFGLLLEVTLVAEARFARNLPGSDASPPHTCPLFRGISCNAGGGIMHVDAALPPNDWCNINPVGHIQVNAKNTINTTSNSHPIFHSPFADKVKTH